MNEPGISQTLSAEHSEFGKAEAKSSPEMSLWEILNSAFDRREAYRKKIEWSQWYYLGAGVLLTLFGVVVWLYLRNHQPAPFSAFDKDHGALVISLVFVGRVFAVASIGAAAGNFFQLHRSTRSEAKDYFLSRILADAQREIYLAMKKGNADLDAQFIETFVRTTLILALTNVEIARYGTRDHKIDNSLDIVTLVKQKIDPAVESIEAIARVLKDTKDSVVKTVGAVKSTMHEL